MQLRVGVYVLHGFISSAPLELQLVASKSIQRSDHGGPIKPCSVHLPLGMGEGVLLQTLTEARTCTG